MAQRLSNRHQAAMDGVELLGDVFSHGEELRVLSIQGQGAFDERSSRRILSSDLTHLFSLGLTTGKVELLGLMAED